LAARSITLWTPDMARATPAASAAGAENAARAAFVAVRTRVRTARLRARRRSDCRTALRADFVLAMRVAAPFPIGIWAARHPAPKPTHVSRAAAGGQPARAGLRPA
jgi:hypothetical protein